MSLTGVLQCLDSLPRGWYQIACFGRQSWWTSCPTPPRRLIVSGTRRWIGPFLGMEGRLCDTYRIPGPKKKLNWECCWDLGLLTFSMTFDDTFRIGMGSEGLPTVPSDDIYVSKMLTGIRVIRTVHYVLDDDTLLYYGPFDWIQNVVGGCYSNCVGAHILRMWVLGNVKWDL